MSVQIKRRMTLWAMMCALAVNAAGCGTDDVPDRVVTDTLDDALRFDEIAMRCTHNSYHRLPKKVAHPSHNYEHAPLDVQLEDYGVRAFEIDVHGGEGYPVRHIPLIDPNTTCENLAACLGTIAGWSDKNPGHQMLVVWIEIKDELSRSRIRDYPHFDAAIVRAIGRKRLFTPADLAGTFASPRARLESDGWPTVGETRGRIMLVLLDVDAPHYEGYRADGHQGVMFSRAREEDYGASWAAVAKVDDPRDGHAIARALEHGLLVASNTGGAEDDDATATARREAALLHGSHMLCDDFPAPVEGRNYWLDIPAWTPSGCNAVTAPPSCGETSSASVGRTSVRR